MAQNGNEGTQRAMAKTGADLDAFIHNADLYFKSLLIDVESDYEAASPSPSALTFRLITHSHRWSDSFLDRMEWPQKPMRTFRQCVTHAGEVYSEIQIILRRSLPGRQQFVVSFSSNTCNYWG